MTTNEILFLILGFVGAFALSAALMIIFAVKHGREQPALIPSGSVTPRWSQGQLDALAEAVREAAAADRALHGDGADGYRTEGRG